MIKVRLFGVLLLVIGLLMVGAGIIGTSVDFDILIGALIPGSVLVVVGTMMLVWPGATAPQPGKFDFAEWFESLPLRERIRYFVATGIGGLIGFALLVHFFGWDLWGLVL